MKKEKLKAKIEEKLNYLEKNKYDISISEKTKLYIEIKYLINDLDDIEEIINYKTRLNRIVFS